ncbi:hypothetical protein J2W56_006810 [Nocardia kruczakiae]|uniref:Luciferase-like monooxygenase n=1 Tax=Nocardia kruczakiae TaxID=261477 RepID=A0ABU1XRN4_9NOCA|nr:hypothetical protein [Nocardia kruczakiae]
MQQPRSPSTVLTRLQDLAEATEADELLIKTDLYHPRDRRESFKLLADDLLAHSHRQTP